MLKAGTRFRPYEIAAPLGAGGMGEVYRARDTELGRDVAIKVLPAAFTTDAQRVARFEQEAKTLAALNHGNIAHIYGIERSGGTTALAIELVEGPTLVERIAQGRIPVDEALAIATQIAGALEAAHERGIVHRDLKPANIKLTHAGHVKVLDFGIAKALDPHQPGSTGPAALTTPAQTEAGLLLGTAAYMSPEQARGKRVDQRTDIWAFGCVLYEMLTGKAAFLGEDTTSTLARVLETDVDLAALPSRVSPSVRRTLELCLQKNASKRLADMRDVRLALSGTFESPAPVQPLWRRALPLAATLALGLLLASAYFLGVQPPATRVEPAVAPSISRFVITPPATAPLANLSDTDLAISPDGRRIAYWAQQPDTGDIEVYVRDLDTLDARAIPGTAHTPGRGRSLFFSADGRSIGYGTPDGAVVSFAIDGRPPVNIVDQVAAFAGAWWSFDDSVIFSSGRRLERVSAAGGGMPQPLMPTRQQGGVLSSPVLLPGGRAVLFHAFGDSAGNRVDVLDLNTGVEKTVIDSATTPAYVDSGHIVFERGNTMMAVPFDASELAVTGEPVALMQGFRRTTGGGADYALASNGTLVYVPETSVARATVVWVDRTGQTTGRAVPEPVQNPRDPRLSPDGRRLLLVTGAEGAGEIWNYDLRGRPPIRLALANDNRLPIWSPDGGQVALLVSGTGLATLAADGNTRTPQSLHAGNLLPEVWSAGGELILSRANGDIVVTSATPSGDLRVVVASDSAEFDIDAYDAALSPDGRWLAYASNRTGQNEVWVQNYPDGAPVRVSSSGGYEPLWSVDGRELFYRQGDAVMAVVVDTGAEFSFDAPQRLFSGPYEQRPREGARAYDVARDGRFLMILPGDENDAPPQASIVVVENFVEEIKQRVRPSGR